MHSSKEQNKFYIGYVHMWHIDMIVSMRIRLMQVRETRYLKKTRSRKVLSRYSNANAEKK